ncbi:MAG: histidinol-phosphate transaminase [Chroococcales cyanobacterium]
MLEFIRSDLAHLNAYIPNPSGETSINWDRLDANESPLDLPKALKEKLAWQYQETIEANRYPDGSHYDLKEAIASYVNQSAAITDISATHISVGNGSDELIRSLLMATCLGGEGSIFVANPTFSMYQIIAETLGISVISGGRLADNFAIDLSEAQSILEKTQNPPIRVVFVVSPNSPTGNALTEEELDWLRQLPQNILVVIDEAYFEFSQTSVVGELLQHPNWVILRTFSKAFRLAAHRVGYAIAFPEIITVLEKIRLPYNLPSFSQAAAKLALEYASELLDIIPTLLAERQRLFEALSQDTRIQVWPSAANFLYLRPNPPYSDHKTLAQITQTLKSQGTLIRHTGGGLRISIGTPEENNRTLERFQGVLS